MNTKRALDASEGGKARAKKLTPEERKEIARKAARARWAKIKREEGIVQKTRKEQASGRMGNTDEIRILSKREQASGRMGNTDEIEDDLPFLTSSPTNQLSMSCLTALLSRP